MFIDSITMDEGGSWVKNFPGRARASFTMGLRAESDLTASDVETAITKVMELVLRDCAVTWGPGISRESSPFGSIAYYLTLNPEMMVEIAVFSQAYTGVATVWIEDQDLIDSINESVMEWWFVGDADFWTCSGRSHPEFQFMVESTDAIFYEVSHGLWSFDRNRILEDNEAPPPNQPEIEGFWA